MASIVFNEPLEQFLVEVPNKGYVYSSFPGQKIDLIPIADKACVDDLEYARELVRRTHATYDALGVSDVGDTVRILRRTITLTRSDWKELADPKTPESSSGTTE